MNIVGVIMGSDSDLAVMKNATEILDQFGVTYETRIVSAHRTPEHMFRYARNAAQRGLKVIIAGAGGAAHLPGMVASMTILPVIGVPIRSSNSLDGWDSILSILQMPGGVPVGTVALNGSKNAALLAVRILAASNPKLQTKLENYMENMKKEVLTRDQSIRKSAK
ncbi:MAG: 5-(carboxyamino)imidazole ribonucleotide mutase [Saprospiraceae bacterium]|nr:5-(carboxyamino)imidazole ribonucleotide mutase [Saprospiraceae bacterium]HMW40569.1 5-(carboxyamino)imidazole ribonucleotide mutase [Saprospiraceae bacterium]HMX89389.1 5-(carboxyamino)imidazole ribonucleotide mutase [Saprospiraceae bacterium]HMZ40812.1 5-(carboxyamino)imidazole ribonucleotide mutase [Saprospiraceae bacterium]HNA63596.1 5-(carboxyamino)imidazole ribonucleotide mutase [Saprospiraceae bacterium]